MRRIVKLVVGGVTRIVRLPAAPSAPPQAVGYPAVYGETY